MRRVSYFKKSNDLLRKALKIQERNMMNSGVTFMNMAANYLAMGLYKMALKFSKESIINL